MVPPEDVIGVDGQAVPIASLQSPVFAQTVAQLTVTQFEKIQNGAPSVGDLGILNAGFHYAGDGTVKLGIAVELEQTSGADTGIKDAIFISQVTSGNASAAGGIGPALNVLFGHGGTGAVGSTSSGLLVAYGVSLNVAPGVAVGSIATIQGIQFLPDVSGGLSSATTLQIDARHRTPVTGAGHTIATKKAIQIDDQGTAQVTTGTALQIAAQSKGLGISNQAAMQEDSFLDVGPIAAPANPAAGYWRLYVDVADGTLKARNSAGTVRSLAAP
jgi:hypothetical protein